MRRGFNCLSDYVPAYPFHMCLITALFLVLCALEDVCTSNQVALVNSLIGKILCSPPEPDLKISLSSSRRSQWTLQKPERIQEREGKKDEHDHICSVSDHFP